jgi:hypothetical protein
MKKEKEQEQKIDIEPYRRLYAGCKILYLLQVGEAYLPFVSHLEASRHQAELLKRGVSSELHIVEL